jgi:hypothetical protein
MDAKARSAAPPARSWGALALVLALCAGACGRDPVEPAPSTPRDARAPRLPAQPDVAAQAADPDAMTLTPAGQSVQDAGVIREVREALATDAELSSQGRGIRISAQDNVLTLRGTVRNPAEKQRVEAIAEEKAAGSHRVESELEIVEEPVGAAEAEDSSKGNP